jgi:hypothetical protein
MPDYSAAEIAVYGGFTFTAGILISFVMQAVKDFAPNLSGRWAVAVVYLIGTLSALVIIDQAEPAPDWGERSTWYAAIPLAFVLSETARGAYERIFKRALGALIEMAREQMSSGATVTATATTEPDGVSVTSTPAGEAPAPARAYIHPERAGVVDGALPLAPDGPKW